MRYHLSTALVVVGCEYPERLTEVSDALGAQLADENAHVRGRAAEAFGLLARSAADMPLPETLAVLADDEESFAAGRARFALVVGEPSDRNEQVETGEGIGTVEAIRATTDGIVAEITAPDGDGEWPALWTCAFRRLSTDMPAMRCAVLTCLGLLAGRRIETIRTGPLSRLVRLREIVQPRPGGAYCPRGIPMMSDSNNLNRPERFSL